MTQLIFITQLLFISLNMIKPIQHASSQYIILGYSHTNKNYIKYFNAICVCGKENKLTSQEVKKNISCGCLSRFTKHKTHGLSKSAEYKSWQSIKERCINTNNIAYKNYGGRGIKMCNEWAVNFSAFLLDMGFKPTINHTIERVDVNGNYQKDNCIWATRKQQANNRRSNYMITYKGVTKNRSEWADLIGVSVRTIASRCRANKPIEIILKEYKA